MTEQGAALNILLVDDHSLMREGLRYIIDQNPDLKVVGEAGNGREAVELVRLLAPDVVLMDISMPEMNGIEATRSIQTFNLSTRVVALSIHTDRQFVLEAIRAGVVGFLPKNCSAQELFDAVSCAVQDKFYFADPQCALYAQEFQDEPAKVEKRDQALTNREREVLQLIAEGYNTKEVAFALGLSVKTIEFHRQHIMKKLSVNNLADLTKYAVRTGIITL